MAVCGIISLISVIECISLYGPQMASQKWQLYSREKSSLGFWCKFKSRSCWSIRHELLTHCNEQLVFSNSVKNNKNTKIEFCSNRSRHLNDQYQDIKKKICHSLRTIDSNIEKTDVQTIIAVTVVTLYYHCLLTSNRIWSLLQHSQL